MNCDVKKQHLPHLETHQRLYYIVNYVGSRQWDPGLEGGLLGTEHCASV